MKNTAFRFFYKIHTYAGLFVALHFIILAITGSILLFKDEIEGTSLEESSAPAETVNSMSIQEYFLKVSEKYPNERPLAFSFVEHDTGVGQFRLGKENSKEYRGARRVYIDTVSGDEVAAPIQQSSLMDWILRLHREFLLGSNGKLYVAFIGILYAFVLISGIFIYGNFSKKSSFGEVRKKTPRSFSSDLHRFLGVTTFAWGLAIGITGSFLGLTSTLIKIYQYQELRALTEQYPTAPEGPLANLDVVLKTAQDALPDSTFDYLAFPDTQFSPPGHFLVLMHGNTPFTERLVELVVIDARSGALTGVRELPWYLKFTMLSEPLHFGNYGGWTLKVIWLIFALASLSLPIFGMFIWYHRRRKSSSLKAPRTIQTWSRGLFSHTWSVPLLISLVTLSGLLGSFLLQGWANRLSTFSLLIPVYFMGHVLWNLKDKRNGR